jgi:hypothetical protein
MDHVGEEVMIRLILKLIMKIWRIGAGFGLSVVLVGSSGGLL